LSFKAREKAIFFQTLAAFRKWLEQHYAKVDAVWLGFYKKGSGKPSITWSESVDKALCFGWKDGVRQRIDDISYRIRSQNRIREGRSFDYGSEG
jgi:uncharacterized protein YdeI (YjbR/CyaY-like superfamily)